MDALRKAFVGVAFLVGSLALLPVFILAAPFLAVSSLMTRIERHQSRKTEHLSWRQLVQYEPEMGWRPRANMDVYGRADEPFRLTTGPDGWRGSVGLSEADIVVFGDSFAFGHGVEDDSMFVRYCSDVKVKSIGSDGYSMVHSLLWMERLAPQLHEKTIVWFVYLGNDLHEALLPNMGRYRMPFVRQCGKAWQIVTDHVDPEPWPISSSPRDYYESLAELSCTTKNSARTFAAADYLIGRAHALCTGMGARLIVASIPMRVQLTRRGRGRLRQLAPSQSTFDVDRPDTKLRGSCTRRNVEFVALKPSLSPRHYLLKDIHWTPAGHRKVGSVIADLY